MHVRIHALFLSMKSGTAIELTPPAHSDPGIIFRGGHQFIPGLYHLALYLMEL
uniref:Uncharacterized protein n=1 Tax=Anguilla anguilla TaxID=7936 RepID=A0A0E9WMH4_ANGAN